jgi:YD repeat-containing protein
MAKPGNGRSRLWGRRARRKSAATENVFMSAQFFSRPCLAAFAFAACVAMLATPASQAGTDTYKYDALGRLEKVTHDDGGTTTYVLDAAGNRTLVSTIGPDVIPPSAPSNLAFTQITPTSARAGWQASTDNRGIQSYDYRLNGGSWTSLGITTFVNLGNLVASTTYTFEVRARDTADLPSTVSSGQFTTAPVNTPDTTPPSQPGALSFSVGLTTATASWQPATDNVAVTGYEYRLNAAPSWTTVPSGTSVSMSGLNDGTTYSFEARARDAAGNFGTPRSGSFTTTSGTGPTTPGAPSFTAVTGTSATANWGASIDDVRVAGYEYRLNGAASWSVITNPGPTQQITTANLTSLSPGTSYLFEVRAFDTPGNRSAVASAPFNTPDTIAPTQPPTLEINSITATTATALWGNSSDNVAVTGYEYRLNSASTWTPSAGTSIGLSGLTPQTAYVFEVRALDGAGNPSPGRSSSFATLPAPDTTPPSQPGALSFSSISATGATVSWGASTDNVGVTGYDYRVVGQSWNSVGGSTTSGPVSGLSASTNYTVEVFARDAVGNFSAVQSNSFQTSPPPPFSATIAVTGSAPIDLRALANAAGYNGAQGATITFQVASGVTITGVANGGIALDTGTWPTGSHAINLTLEISGRVYGGGGNGGVGGNGANVGTAGTAGGDALYARVPLSVVVNPGGELRSGGGGGGGGGGGVAGPPTNNPVAGGNGGGGFPNGTGPGAAGEGTTSAGGAGSGGTSGSGGAFGGAGGAGGGPGVAGVTGVTGSSASGPPRAGGAGGATGFAVRKNGNTVTVTNNGTISGAQG